MKEEKQKNLIEELLKCFKNFEKTQTEIESKYKEHKQEFEYIKKNMKEIMKNNKV